MPLDHCILHKIERTTPDNDITTDIKATETDSAGPMFSLFEQLKHSLQRSVQKQFGHFDQSQEDNPFPQWLNEYQAGRITFVSLSARIPNDLEIKLGDSGDAFEAHVMIAQESLLDQKIVYVFWLTHHEGLCIDSNLEVVNSRSIDTSRISYAVKLHVGEWLGHQSQKYLTLVSLRGNKELRDAFIRTIGFAEGIDRKEETQEFLAIVDQYAESLPEEAVQEKKAKLLEYCIEQDKVGEPVRLAEISTQLNEKEPMEFSSFVSDRQRQKRPEVHTDRRSLKRYLRFFGRDRRMSISFDADRFGRDIVFEADTGRLIISNVPESLRQQLSTQGSGASEDG